MVCWICSAAIVVIAREGLDGFNFQQVGEELGTIRAHIKYHYPDKLDLFLDVVSYCFFDAQTFTVEPLKTAMHWRQKLDAMIDGAFDWTSGRPAEVNVITSFIHLAGVHPRCRALYEDVREHGRKRFEVILQEGLVGEGEGSSVAELAVSIQSMMYGSIIHMRALGDEKHAQLHRRRTHQSCASLLAGYLAGKG